MIFHRRQLSLLIFILVWYNTDWVWNELWFDEWVVNSQMIIIVFDDVKFVTVITSTHNFWLWRRSCEIMLDSSSFSLTLRSVLFSLRWDVKQLISHLFDDQCANDTFEIEILSTAALSFVLNRKCRIIIIEEIEWKCVITLLITSVLSVFVWRDAFTITSVFVTVLVECFNLLSYDVIDMILFDQSSLIVCKEVKMLESFLFHFEVFT